MSSISISASNHGKTLIQENKVVLLWSFTVWLVVMNTTMFHVALPSVLLELSLTTSTASWIVSGYSIVFAISTLTFSRLSDYLPISRLLLIGLTLLGTASVIGFFSHHFYLLLASRVLQAAGAGAVPGLAMVLVARYIPISRRGKAMAFIASASSLGFGLGPVIGGAITQYLGWNYLFMVTGLVVLLIPMFIRILPKEGVQKVTFDTFGGVLAGLSVTGLLLFLSTLSYFLLVGSIILIVLFWKHTHKIESPFIQPSLLKNRQYMKLLFIGFTAFFTHFATLFLMPIILTIVFNKDPAAIGMIIFPGAIMSAIAAQFIGRLIDRFGNAPLIIFGQTSLIIATVMLSFTSTLSPYFILITYMFMSTGFSALTSSIANEVTRVISNNEVGAGMGLAQLIQFFGGAFGVTIAGIMITIQEGFLGEIVYRNIFMGLSLLILTAIVTFSIYYRKKNLYCKGPHPIK
jgi:DHA2 family metal-tetracycline-proton antiporter-like MFS transporter